MRRIDMEGTVEDGDSHAEPRNRPTTDEVEHPRHYTDHPSGVECIDIAEHFGFSLGNAIKYIWRAGLKTKDVLLDLRKARWYLNREIARLEKKESPVSDITGETSDGYHTFNELYHFRMLYNALLFNEWAARGSAEVHKSWRHHDGELCFGGGWFVVVANTVAGQITNHYKAQDWDRFCIPERETAAEWDGHDAAEAARRMEHLLDIAARKSEPMNGEDDLGGNHTRGRETEESR